MVGINLNRHVDKQAHSYEGVSNGYECDIRATEGQRMLNFGHTDIRSKTGSFLTSRQDR